MSIVHGSNGRIRLFGERLRQERIGVGLTQFELARKSGYSDRLIRKAEGGGTVNRQTLADIVAALTECGSQIRESELVSDPVSIAKEFVRNYDLHGKQMLAFCGDLLDEEFVFECAGDPSTSVFSGTFYGAQGFQRWLDLFLGVLVHESDQHLQAEYYVNGHEVVARFEETFNLQGQTCPPVWTYLRFNIEGGKIIRIRDDFDTATVNRFLPPHGATKHITFRTGI